MFKSMRLKNFKAYKDSGEVPLAPLTVIVGANNSGKSTLFHALLALAQTANGPEQGWAPHLVTKGLVDLNTFDDMVHTGKRSRADSFEISLGLDTHAARPRNDSTNGRKILIPDHADIAFHFSRNIEETAVESSTLRSGKECVISVKRNPRGGWALVNAPPGAPPGSHIDFRSVFPCLDMPKENRPSMEYMNAVLTANYHASLWKELFAKQIKHVSALRSRVPYQAGVGARDSSASAQGGANLLADLGNKERDDTGKTRLDLLNEWLIKKEILKRIHVVEVGKGVRKLLGDDFNGSANINLAAMGEGISQILPIVAYSTFRMSNDCLLVEEPEAHVHPALQGKLADLFIEVAQTGRRQVLVETHSENLLLRVRVRIAKGELDPGLVSILFVEKIDGESFVRPLDLNSRGHFSDWPKGFFDEAYQEAMALATAASKKG